MVREIKVNTGAFNSTYITEKPKREIQVQRFCLILSVASLVHFYSLDEIFDWLRNRTIKWREPLCIRYLLFSSKYVLGWTELLGVKLDGQGFYKIHAFPIQLTAFLLTAVEIFCKTLCGKTYLLIQSNLLDVILGAFFLVLSTSAFTFRSHFFEDLFYRSEVYGSVFSMSKFSRHLCWFLTLPLPK